MTSANPVRYCWFLRPLWITNYVVVACRISIACCSNFIYICQLRISRMLRTSGVGVDRLASAHLPSTVMAQTSHRGFTRSLLSTSIRLIFKLQYQLKLGTSGHPFVGHYNLILKRENERLISD